MTDLAQLDERIAKCRKILDVDPNSQIFAALAEAHRKRGDLDDAFRICQSGLRIHPSYGSAHVVMAKVNLDRGLYDWAEVEGEKAAQLDGRTRAIELLLAEIYIYRGEYPKAIALLTKLHDANPDNNQIQRLLDIAQKLPEGPTVRMPAPVMPEVVAPTLTVRSLSKPERESAAELEERAPVNRRSSLYAKELLAKAIATAGIDGALFVNTEGLVIESEWTLRLDSTVCGATLSDVVNALNEKLLRSAFGCIETILIETDPYTFFVARVPDGVLLFVANASANLGSLRMRVENLLSRYRPRNED